MKLTESAIAKLPGKKTGKKADDLILFDDDLPGFGLRIRTSGSRTWVFQYKLGSQHRRITLGKYPALHPAQARKTAARLHAEVRLGNDPAAVKAEKQVRATETFEAIAKNYLERRRGQVRHQRSRKSNGICSAILHRCTISLLPQSTGARLQVNLRESQAPQVRFRAIGRAAPYLRF